MTTERINRGGRPSSISNDEIIPLLDKGMTASEIARYFTGRGRPITQQAISLRRAKIRDGEQDRTRNSMPWVVRTEHSTGWVYRAASAYGKWRVGRGVSPQEMKWARALEDWLIQNDAVLTYDYNEGFMLRNRRPGDREGLLV